MFFTPDKSIDTKRVFPYLTHDTFTPQESANELRVLPQHRKRQRMPRHRQPLRPQVPNQRVPRPKTATRWKEIPTLKTAARQRVSSPDRLHFSVQ